MARKRQIAKVITSTLVLISLATIILIGKKQTLIAEKKNDTYVFNPALTPVYTNVSDYGATIAQNTKSIPKATVEHIALHAPKKATSQEKIIRYGRLVRYPDAQATILICHGFMCDKFDVGFLRHMFPQGKYNFMTFDFRAHGENSDGQRCTFGRDESLDVITAAYFIKNHEALKELPILVYGFSMGAVAAIEAQSKDSSLFNGMILDCPFDSSENIIRRSLESIQFSFLGYDFSVPACGVLQKYAFHPYVQSMIKNLLKAVANLDAKNIDIRMYPINPARSAQSIRIPCYFIHCKNDEKVSVDAIKAVFNSAGCEYKELWLTNGRRHFDSYFYNPEKYIKEVRGFIDKVVSGSIKDLHLNKVIEDPDEVLAQIFDINIEKLAKETHGKSFEDLKLMLDMAFIHIGIKGSVISQDILEWSLDAQLRKIIDLDNREVAEDEQELLAAHYAGQALVHILLDLDEKIAKVTTKQIVTKVKEEAGYEQFYKDDHKKQTGLDHGALFTYYEHDSLDIKNQSINEVTKKAKTLLAGRIAERMLTQNASAFFGWKKNTAYNMIKSLVADGIDLKSLSKAELNKVSDDTHAMIKQFEQEIEQLLTENMDSLQALAQALKEKHTLSINQIMTVIAPKTEFVPVAIAA